MCIIFNQQKTYTIIIKPKYDQKVNNFSDVWSLKALSMEMEDFLFNVWGRYSFYSLLWMLSLTKLQKNQSWTTKCLCSIEGRVWRQKEKPLSEEFIFKD